MRAFMRRNCDIAKAYRKITKSGSDDVFSMRNVVPFRLLLSCICVTALFWGAFSLFLVSADWGSRTRQFLSRASSNESLLIQLEQNVRSRGIVMSCPVGQAQNHRGNWKPRRMVRGADAVIQQLNKTDSQLPLYFGYYQTEKVSALHWCQNISECYRGNVDVFCFKIPELFPKNMYGYAKIFAIRHAPVDEVLWIDCDVYPVRSLEPLFEDDNYQITGAMFWPDSRDFFDESKLESVLHISSLKALFPLKAWWVKQGFDSGLVLINRKLCTRELEALCIISRSSALRDLRSLSMGDKDIFHLVWMLHARNFTLVPYIGESGNIQTSLIVRTEKDITGKRRFSPGSVSWKMSSQLKFGRDGQVYALHQLHRQRSFALVATLANGPMFYNPKHAGLTKYVKPSVLVRKDLRIMRNERDGGSSTEDGEIIRSIEKALTHQYNNSQRVPSVLEEARRRREPGLMVKRGPRWLNEAASEMDRLWNPEPNSKYFEITRERARSPRFQDALRKRKFSKRVRKRLGNDLKEKKPPGT